MKPFFIIIPNFWALACWQTIWTDEFWGILGVFEQFINTHMKTVASVTMRMSKLQIILDPPPFFYITASFSETVPT